MDACGYTPEQVFELSQAEILLLMAALTRRAEAQAAAVTTPTDATPRAHTQDFATQAARMARAKPTASKAEADARRLNMELNLAKQAGWPIEDV